MKERSILQSALQECKTHLQRLDYAWNKMAPMLPFTEVTVAALPEETVSFLDQYVFRFSKLQDAIGNKLFKSLLSAVGEDYREKPFIDVFHRLEQLGVVKDYEQWNRLRALRNEIAHDYDVSDAGFLEKMEGLLESRTILKRYLHSVEDYCSERGLS